VLFSGPDNSQKLPSQVQSNTWILGPTGVCPPIGISVGSAVFLHGSRTWPTDTDHITPSVAMYHILHTDCMQYSLKCILHVCWTRQFPVHTDSTGYTEPSRRSQSGVVFVQFAAGLCWHRCCVASIWCSFQAFTVFHCFTEWPFFTNCPVNNRRAVLWIRCSWSATRPCTPNGSWHSQVIATFGVVMLLLIIAWNHSCVWFLFVPVRHLRITSTRDRIKAPKLFENKALIFWLFC